MSLSKTSSRQQNIPPCSIGSHLSVRTWGKIFSCLTKDEQRACALISRRLAILLLCKPYPELEIMRERRTAALSAYPTQQEIYGPTHRFLFSYRGNNKEQEEIQSIFNEMNKDPDVAKTILDLCKIETAHPDYIPLYSAINIPAFILALCTQRFFSLIYPSSLCNIPMIRFPSPDSPRTVEEHFKKFPVKDTLDYTYKYDYNPDVGRALLSCNPHLFTNLHNVGESTWFFYLTGVNINPPTPQEYFKMLCNKYKLDHSLQEEFVRLYKQLDSLRHRFSPFPNRGMILQFLVPPALIDKVAYTSLGFGMPLSSELTVSQRCLKLRKNPRFNEEEQVRLLAQSLFEDNGIKVFTHGCALFSDKEAQTDVSTQSYFATKNTILGQIQDLFASMLLPVPEIQEIF